MQVKLSLSVLLCWLLPISLATQSASLLPSSNSYGFVENVGQFRDQNGRPAPAVRYLLEITRGLHLQLNETGFSYSLQTKAESTVRDSTEISHLNRLDIRWLGGNPKPDYVADRSASDKLHYPTLAGYKPTTAQHFGRVVAKNIYPGIDIEFVNFNSGKISTEYNFILNESARLSDIQLKYQGGQLLALADDALYIQVGEQVLVEHLPCSFLQQDGQTVPISYCELSNSHNQFVIGFSGPNDYITEPLVIDPVPTLIWSTYLGGEGADEIRDLAVDADGNIYGIGQTDSPANLVSTGAFQSSITGDEDILLFKFNAEGERLWSTYFGGDEKDTGEDLAIGPDGDIYLCATVESESGITTADVHQEVYGGGFLDGLVARFDTDGQLVWSTYIGGTINENCFGLAVNQDNHIYVTGRTKSFNAIANEESFQSSIAGDIDAFLAKFDSEGQLLWSTYFGGQQVDIGQSVAVANNGDVFISGWTASEDNLSTFGVEQTSYGGGQADIFLARFRSNGNRMWCGYLGGDNNDFANDLATDAEGNLYIVGSSFSPNNIGTMGTHQPSSDGSGDALLVKYNPEGQRIWGTYYGGEQADILNDIAIDTNGDVYLVGNARSTNEIATANAAQSNFGGGLWDGMLLKFNTDGQRIWGTYLGGSSEDMALAVAVASPSHIYVAGTTNSDTDFATTAAFQLQSGGEQDAFLQRYTSCSSPELSLINGGYYCDALPDSLHFQLSNTDCASLIYSLDGEVQPPLEIRSASFHWPRPSFSDSLQLLSVNQGECNGSITGPDFLQQSTPMSSSAVYRDCSEEDSTYQVIFSMQGANGVYYELDNLGEFSGNVFTSFPIPYYNPFSFRVSAGDSCNIIIINGHFNCTDVCPDIGLTILGEEEYCRGDTLNMQVRGGEDFRWSGPDDYTSTEAVITIDGLSTDQAGNYQVIVGHTFACFDTLSVAVEVYPTPVVNLEAENLLSCLRLSTNLVAATPFAGTYRYQFNDKPLQLSSMFANAEAGQHRVRVWDERGCSNAAELVLLPPDLADCAIYIPTAFSPNLDGLHDKFRIFPPTGLEGRVLSYQIFDRWGGLIYSAANFSLNETTGWWDGLDLEQQLVSQGVYVYSIQLELLSGEARQLTGTVTVLH
ncbi:MAG: SBBP repeat-containing protein [Bacteroidota bacterium]